MTTRPPPIPSLNYLQPHFSFAIRILIRINSATFRAYRPKPFAVSVPPYADSSFHKHLLKSTAALRAAKRNRPFGADKPLFATPLALRATRAPNP